MADHYLDEGLTGRTRIDDAFAREGIVPDIAISALDADVIKSYVELGMGVGILAAMAFEPERDTKLRRLDGLRLFESNTSSLGNAVGDTCAATSTDLSSCARLPSPKRRCARRYNRRSNAHQCSSFGSSASNSARRCSVVRSRHTAPAARAAPAPSKASACS